MNDNFNLVSSCIAQHVSLFDEMPNSIKVSEFLKVHIEKSKILSQKGRELLYNLKHKSTKKVNYSKKIDYSYLNYEENWMGKNKNDANIIKIENDPIFENIVKYNANTMSFDVSDIVNEIETDPAELFVNGVEVNSTMKSFADEAEIDSTMEFGNYPQVHEITINPIKHKESQDIKENIRECVQNETNPTTEFFVNEVEVNSTIESLANETEIDSTMEFFNFPQVHEITTNPIKHKESQDIRENIGECVQNETDSMMESFDNPEVDEIITNLKKKYEKSKDIKENIRECVQSQVYFNETGNTPCNKTNEHNYHKSLLLKKKGTYVTPCPAMKIHHEQAVNKARKTHKDNFIRNGRGRHLNLSTKLNTF